MVYLDGFSGYGGFHLAFEQAGWKFDEVYFSEIDKYAIANYSYNFPKSKYAGSITTISRESIPSIDLFTFGWPCQDNSIAGKRKGQQSGTRSGLLYEAVRIINEFKPRNFVAENVLGLLSVNKGIDIIESLKLLSDLNESCPQYDIEMQLLNTRWVLPQNRERLFFVGHLRGSGSRQVFPIGEDTAKIQGSSVVIAGSTIGDECTRLGERDIVYNPVGIMGCLNAIDYKQPKQILIPSGTKSGFETAEAGDSINLEHLTSETRRGRVGKGVAQILDTSCNQAVIGAMRGRNIVNGSRKDYNGAPTEQRIEINEAGVSNCLTSVQKDNLVLSGTWRTHKDGKGFREMQNDLSPTIPARAREDGSGQPCISQNGNIRRLTPMECERLQGLPDNHTKYGIINGQVKELSDTQRYRLCGNGVSVPIVKMIAEKLLTPNNLKQ